MIKLQVVSVNGSMYTLKDENGKEFNHYLTFFDVQGGVNVGDIISIHEELFNPKYKEYSHEYRENTVKELCKAHKKSV